MQRPVKILTRRRSPPPRPHGSASRVLPGPTGNPAARRQRAKCIIFASEAVLERLIDVPSLVSRSESRHTLTGSARGREVGFYFVQKTLAASLPWILAISSWYLSSVPMRVVDGVGVQFQTDPGSSAPGSNPGSRRHAWHLEQVLRAELLHEADDMAWSTNFGRAPGMRAFDDRHLTLGVGIVDPVIEATPLQRIVDLTRAVGGDDHDRPLIRPGSCRSPGWSPESRKGSPGDRPQRAHRSDQAHRSGAPAPRRHCGSKRLQERPADQELIS